MNVNIYNTNICMYVCVQFLPLLNIKSSRADALFFLMLSLEISVCHSIDSFFFLFYNCMIFYVP